MTTLKSIPAFGFETAHCNAEQIYRGQIHRIKANSQAKPIFWSKHHVKPLAKDAYKSSNAYKILGYFPGIGTFVGIKRISNAIKREYPREFSRLAFVIRGAIEALSVGSLLIIPDMTVTAIRLIKSKPLDEPNVVVYVDGCEYSIHYPQTDLLR